MFLSTENWRNTLIGAGSRDKTVHSSTFFIALERGSVIIAMPAPATDVGVGKVYHWPLCTGSGAPD